VNSWVKVRCAHCRGRLQVPSHDVLLTVHTSQSWRDTFRFVCPLCHEENAPAATAEDVTLLVSAGVRVERVAIPDEVEDPTRTSGQAVTWDDVLDFAAAATRTEHLAREAAPWRSVK